MSVQSEFPVIPMEIHHACTDAVGYYGNCCSSDANSDHFHAHRHHDRHRHYHHHSTGSMRLSDNEQCGKESLVGCNAESDFDYQLSDVDCASTLMSMSYTTTPNLRQERQLHQDHHQQQQRQRQQRHGNTPHPQQQMSRESPGETAASFDCQAMYDSEFSSSPSSVVSPSAATGDGQMAQTPEHGGTISAHHISTNDGSSHHYFQHHHNQTRRHQPCHFQYHQDPPSPKSMLLDEDISIEMFRSRNNHQPNTKQQHHQLHYIAQPNRAAKRRAGDTTDLPIAGGGNRKERRRTQSINTAFAELRDCIPNVPADTKLSKIKTLRLATSYIAYLTEIVTRDDNMNGGSCDGFIDGLDGGTAMPLLRADIAMASRSFIKEALKHQSLRSECEVKRKKNRTGWPEHVWALELHQ